MGKWILCAAFGFVSATTVMAADDAPVPTTMPATQPMAGMTHKLFKPYSILTDLTPDQNIQIEKIHKDFLEEQHKLELKQKDDIAAVLTPTQTTELQAAEDKMRAERKMKAAEKKPTTEPAT